MNNNGILRGFFIKTKKILSLLLSVSLLAMSFVGCGKTKTNVDDDEMKTIAIIAKGESHAFWQSVKQGAEDAAKKHEILFHKSSRWWSSETQFFKRQSDFLFKP